MSVSSTKPTCPDTLAANGKFQIALKYVIIPNLSRQWPSFTFVRLALHGAQPLLGFPQYTMARE
jgi:hypothetical protein